MNHINERKLEIARAQLGTALHLFLLDRDSYSVQALACGGCELIEGLAESAQLPTVSTHVIKTYPGLEPKQLAVIRNRYWNAIKHFYGRDRTPRDDDDLLANFSDRDNDAPLFVGWLDYLTVAKKLPVEVQVFQAWWYALNENKLVPNADLTPFRTVFPDIGGADRAEQKRRLRRKIESFRHNRELLADPHTEIDPLVRRVAYDLVRGS